MFHDGLRYALPHWVLVNRLQDRRRALSKLMTAISPSVVWKYVSSNSAASDMARPQNRDLRLSSPVLNRVETMVFVISVPGPFGRNCDRHSTVFRRLSV